MLHPPHRQQGTPGECGIAAPGKHKRWMLANLDYAVTGQPDVQILECKAAGEWGSRLWRDGAQKYIQCQMQHQLAVTGKPAADVAVLLCRRNLQIFRNRV